MTFNPMVSMAQEQKMLVAGANRKEKIRVNTTTRQGTRVVFPNVPEDSPLFGALHQVRVSNPERLKDLPERARANFGEILHADDDGEHDYLLAETTTYGTIRSAVGVLRSGELFNTRNGATQAGHCKTPDQRCVARSGKPVPSLSNGVLQPSSRDHVTDR